MGEGRARSKQTTTINTFFILLIPSYTRSFWLFEGRAVVNSFSSVKKMKFTYLCMGLIVFWNTVNFVGFSVIHVSQGSVATYVRCGGMLIIIVIIIPRHD